MAWARLLTRPGLGEEVHWVGLDWCGLLPRPVPGHGPGRALRRAGLCWCTGLDQGVHWAGLGWAGLDWTDAHACTQAWAQAVI